MINGEYNEKIDVWACGILLYYMLIGEMLIRGETDEEILNNIKNRNFDTAQSLWKNISNDATDLISKMLTHNPEDRITAKEALQHNWIK